MALQLKKLGFSRVRPVEGGLQAWKDAGFALTERPVRQVSAAPASA